MCIRDRATLDLQRNIVEGVFRFLLIRASINFAEAVYFNGKFWFGCMIA